MSTVATGGSSGATTVGPATQVQLHAMLQKSQQQPHGAVATVTLAPTATTTGGVTTATLVPTRVMTLQQQPRPGQAVSLKQGLQGSQSEPSAGGSKRGTPQPPPDGGRRAL